MFGHKDTYDVDKKAIEIQKQLSRGVLEKKRSWKFRKIYRKTIEACNFIKKETLVHVFSCEFYKTC